MRIFKMLQIFCDAGSAEGGSGEGGGGEKKDDKEDKTDEGAKTELEKIRKEIEELKAKSGEKDTTLENLQKQIDKTKDETDKKDLEDLKNKLLVAKNENIVLKLETYKIKALEKEKINTKFSEFITLAPEMTIDDVDKLVVKAKELQEAIKEKIINVNQESNPAFSSGKKKDDKDDFYKRLDEEAKLKEERKEVPKRFN